MISLFWYNLTLREWLFTHRHTDFFTNAALYNVISKKYYKIFSRERGNKSCKLFETLREGIETTTKSKTDKHIQIYYF